MSALGIIYAFGLLTWLGAWACLWSEEPPERTTPAAIVFLFVLGALWPVVLTLGTIVLGVDRLVNGPRPKPSA